MLVIAAETSNVRYTQLSGEMRCGWRSYFRKTAL